jgi:hypothetical protein
MSQADAQLERDEIKKAVFERLEKYRRLSLLEHFAMFMGGAQLLEVQLKGVLAGSFGVEHDRMERWTLGRVQRELGARGCRADFVQLLESLVNYRNHIAHDLLANVTLLKSLVKGAGRFERKILDPATYELEQLLFLAQVTDEHQAWVPALPEGE